jgi:hypothetical protein
MGSKRRGKRQRPPSERKRDRPDPGVLPLERESLRPSLPRERFGPGDAPRLVTVSVPCPECNRCVDVMMYEGAGAQEVALTEHADREGGVCPLSGALVTIPGAPSSPDFDYHDTSEPPGLSEDPFDRKHHPAPPPSDAPMDERLKEYAAACPISTLLKLHQDAREAAERLLEVDNLFLGDADVSDRAFWNERASALEEALEEALMARIGAGIGGGRAGVLEGNIEFLDKASGETVVIPLRSVRVAPNYLTPFQVDDVLAVDPTFPDGLDEEEDDEDDEEAPPA